MAGREIETRSKGAQAEVRILFLALEKLLPEPVVPLTHGAVLQVSPRQGRHGRMS